VLTLSIGATAAIFSVVDAVVLRGLPFPESDRLVAVGEFNVKDAADLVCKFSVEPEENHER
jgi:hypothetical protein